MTDPIFLYCTFLLLYTFMMVVGVVTRVGEVAAKPLLCNIIINHSFSIVFYIPVGPCHWVNRSANTGQMWSYPHEMATASPLTPALLSPPFSSKPFHSRSLRAPAVFTTWLPWVFGGPTVNLNSILRPRGHAALGYSAAASQAGYLAGWQDPVPKSHLGQLSNQSLGWIKSSAEGILERNKCC